MKVKIIDQADGMSVDLFESVLNNFLEGNIDVVHIRINTLKTGILRSTIIYKTYKRPNVSDDIGNR